MWLVVRRLADPGFQARLQAFLCWRSHALARAGLSSQGQHFSVSLKIKSDSSGQMLFKVGRAVFSYPFVCIFPVMKGRLGDGERSEMDALKFNE